MCSDKVFNSDTKCESNNLFCAKNNYANAMNNYFMAEAIFSSHSSSVNKYHNTVKEYCCMFIK